MLFLQISDERFDLREVSRDFALPIAEMKSQSEYPARLEYPSCQGDGLDQGYAHPDSPPCPDAPDDLLHVLSPVDRARLTIALADFLFLARAHN